MLFPLPARVLTQTALEEFGYIEEVRVFLAKSLIKQPAENPFHVCECQ
jgi:hypothetical protein